MKGIVAAFPQWKLEQEFPEIFIQNHIGQSMLGNSKKNALRNTLEQTPFQMDDYLTIWVVIISDFIKGMMIMDGWWFLINGQDKHTVDIIPQK